MEGKDDITSKYSHDPSIHQHSVTRIDLFTLTDPARVAEALILAQVEWNHGYSTHESIYAALDLASRTVSYLENAIVIDDIVLDDEANESGIPKPGAKLKISSTCSSCQKSFNAFIRGHHCRSCGHFFCSKCSSHRQVLPHCFGFNDRATRLCNGCVKYFQNVLDEVLERKQAISNIKSKKIRNYKSLFLSSGKAERHALNDGISAGRRSLKTTPLGTDKKTAPPKVVTIGIEADNEFDCPSSHSSSPVKQVGNNKKKCPGSSSRTPHILKQLSSMEQKGSIDSSIQRKIKQLVTISKLDEADVYIRRLNAFKRKYSEEGETCDEYGEDDDVDDEDSSSTPISMACMDPLDDGYGMNKYKYISKSKIEHYSLSQDAIQSKDNSSQPQSDSMIETQLSHANFEGLPDEKEKIQLQIDEDVAIHPHAGLSNRKSKRKVRSHSYEAEAQGTTEPIISTTSIGNEENELSAPSTINYRSSVRSLSLDIAELQVRRHCVKESDTKGILEGSEDEEILPEILHFAVYKIEVKDTLRKTFGFAKKNILLNRYTLEVFRLKGVVHARGVFHQRFWTFRCDAVKELKDSIYGNEYLDIIVPIGQNLQELTFQFASHELKDQLCDVVREWMKKDKTTYTSTSTATKGLVKPTMSFSNQHNTTEDSIIQSINGFSTSVNSLSALNLAFLNGEKAIQGTSWPASLIIGPINLSDPHDIWGRVSGVISVTNYRVIFTPGDKELSSHETNQRISYIPFFDVVRVSRENIRRSKGYGVTPGYILINCKDFRSMRLELDGPPNVADERTQALTLLIQTMAESSQLNLSADVGQHISEIYTNHSNEENSSFAFSYFLPSSEECNGWLIYDEEKEFLRQGLNFVTTSTSKPFWKIFPNKHGGLCRSYPSKLFFPSPYSATKLHSVAASRAKGRLPVVTWQHPRHRCVLVRSGQPLLGNILTGNASLVDQDLLEVYRRIPGLHYQQANLRPLYVFDARKSQASMGNRISGKGGVEKPHIYPGVVLYHLGIGNIYKMKDSYNSLMKLILPEGITSRNKSWQSLLFNTQWLHHIRKILEGSVKIARVLELEGASTLVHCSDGWDRTSQLVSLAQILLDPYYRTIRGFAVLVEKDWISFGHKFAERLGGDRSRFPNGEKFSPIMLQFIDALWQILHQFPNAFEYNERFLLHVANSLTSGLYGTFLYDSRLQKEADNASSRSVSVWTPILLYTEPYTNKDYQPIDTPIWPWTGYQMIQLWEGYYFQWHPKYPKCRWISHSSQNEMFCRTERDQKSNASELDHFKGTKHSNELGSMPMPEIIQKQKVSRLFW